MLYEMECDQFAETINGKRVPRGRITFRPGLNTVLGDKQGENSIGKSTFLLAVDFCFGGGDYLDSAKTKNDVVGFVGNHVIKFAFKFGDRIERYARSTLNPSEIQICDDNYSETGETLSLDDFKKHLFDAYQIHKAQCSWRSLVGRFSRIYGRHNYSEEFPLQYGDEKPADAIKALEQIYGVYGLIKEFEDNYAEKNKRKTIRTKATNIGELVTVARTKKQVKENLKEIEELEGKLEELLNKEDRSLAEKDTEQLDQAAEIKGQITVLKRRRTRLVSQLNAVKANLEEGLTPTSDDIKDLKEFFPDADIAKIETIEHFHKKMQTILTDEMSDEVKRLEALIAQSTKEVERLEDEQRKLGVPTRVSKKFLDETVKMRSRINFLKLQNEGYDESKELAEQTKEAKTSMEDARKNQLDSVQTIINQEMVRLNDFIYDGKRYAPEIEFSDAKNGNPKYTFGCKWNAGTGENYKNLIIFDLSVLKTTELPFIVHDSLIFKNVADLPIDKIIQLYVNCGKQVFISFDKQEAYTEYTAKTVYDTRVIELYDHGGELFGWSWAEKPDEETEENAADRSSEKDENKN
ncbi:MAG: DUF2326 domain-containing protein [Eubacterium sp.]|jgi:hypothetical protein